MKTVGETNLEIILAKGHLSPAQLRKLEVGSVVLLLDRCPGEPATITCNGRELALVEVYKKDDRWFFQIFDGDWKPKSLPGRLSTERLLDQLPIELRLWSGRVDARTLSSLGAGSVLSAVTGDPRGVVAELTVFGGVVAVGVPVISGEFWGIQITDVVADGWNQGIGTMPTGVPDDLKIYDFSKPDRFSRDQIHALAVLHNTIADRLANFVPHVRSITLRLVDQIAWHEIAEFVDPGASFSELSAGYTVTDGSRSRADQEIEYFNDLDTGKSDPDWDRKFRQRAHDMATALPLERVLIGWSGTPDQLPVELVTSALEHSWGRLFPVQFADQTDWQTPLRQDFLEDFEMVVFVRLQADNGNLTVTYPYRYLRKLLGLLAGLSS